MAYHHPYNRSISTEQKQENARILWSLLRARGWTLNAAAAAMGNWESECNLNSNDPQYASGFPTSETSRDGGFGLAQWTACGDKILWYAQRQGVPVTATDDNPAADPLFQIDYHEFECTRGFQGTGRETWYHYKDYPYLSWPDFKVSMQTPEELAVIYYWSYERSGADDPGGRPANARKWYDYLSSVPVPPTTEKMPFLLLAYAAGVVQ